jgi:DNA topoisomerase-3
MEDAGKTIEDEELREKMKDAGLGTPATRAAIIQRLIQVGYARRERKNIVSTVKGQKLIQVVPQEISSAVTTGKWERALAKMARFTSEAEIAEKQEKFMNSIRSYSAFLTDYAFNGAPQASFPQEDQYTKRRKTNATKPKKHD